jgi:perosamine synthetase
MKIPPLKVTFSRSDRREILRRIDAALASGYVVMGRNVEELEKEFGVRCGAKHAVAVSSGSSALEIAMRHLEVEGRDVLLPDLTFFSTASAVLFAGGRPRLADIDLRTFSVSVKTLEKRLTPRTSGVIVVHIGGIITPEIREIRRWCDDHGLWLIEDAAHAHGSALDGLSAGRFGLAGCFSFFSTKVMTSGEGGMIITDDDAFADKARLLRNHGKPEPWVSFHTHLGSNWRMNEFAAAAGLIQLRNLDKFIAHREKIAARYTRRLAGRPELEPVLPVGPSSWYKYIVLLDGGVNKARLKARLKERGVSLSGEVYDVPLHRQPVLERFARSRFPAAEDAARRHICLPLYYGMTRAEADFVVDQLLETLHEKEIRT